MLTFVFLMFCVHFAFYLRDFRFLWGEQNLSLSLMLVVMFTVFCLALVPRVFSTYFVFIISSFVGEGDVRVDFRVAFTILFSFSIPVTFFTDWNLSLEALCCSEVFIIQGLLLFFWEIKFCQVRLKQIVAQFVLG